MDPKSERPRKVFLRGLPASTPIDDIYNALKNSKLEPLTIAHLHSRKAINRGTPFPLFVVTLRVTPNFEIIFDLDTINHLSVRVEKFKNQPFRQCYRCQRPGDTRPFPASLKNSASNVHSPINLTSVKLQRQKN